MGPKDIHDQLLAVMPTGASHDRDSCSFCSGSIEPDVASQPLVIEGGGAMDKTHTEDDVKAAVAAATAEIATELATLKASRIEKDHESEVATAVEAALAPKDEEIKDLQSKLDTSVLEAEAVKKELAELVALIETEKTRVEQEAEIASRREQRLVAVRAVASFPEEYEAANANRWAALSDEDFEAVCADYKAVAAKETVEPEGISRDTAMLGEREPRRAATKLDATKEVLSGTLRGVNWNTL